jgi:orotate phosphoribosyltransferase
VNGHGAEASEIIPFMNTPLCYEMINASLPYLGRTSPYIFRFPCPVSSEQLLILGERLLQVVEEHAANKRVHIVGIASRGIPMATSVALLARGRREIWLSTTGSGGSVEHVAKDRSDCYTVLVDNSVISGRTLVGIVANLRSAGIRPDLCVRFFDREELDVRGNDPTEVVKRRVGFPIASTFSLRDIIRHEQRPGPKSTILQYAMRYGTASLKAHISSYIDSVTAI